MNITIRGLQESVFRTFKAKAAQEGMRLGDALAMALERWAEEESKGGRVKLKDLKPFNWGKGTERTSKEVDKIAYG
jgi:hypothetical protein